MTSGWFQESILHHVLEYRDNKELAWEGAKELMYSSETKFRYVMSIA